MLTNRLIEMTATEVMIRQNRMPRTPEERRMALQRYLDEATPIQRALCDLEMRMPVAYEKLPDGSLKPIVRHNWPEWAIRLADSYDTLLNQIKERHLPNAH